MVVYARNNLLRELRPVVCDYKPTLQIERNSLLFSRVLPCGDRCTPRGRMHALRKIFCSPSDEANKRQTNSLLSRVFCWLERKAQHHIMRPVRHTVPPKIIQPVTQQEPFLFY